MLFTRRAPLAAVAAAALLAACSSLHWPGSPPDGPLVTDPLRPEPSRAPVPTADRPAGAATATRIDPVPVPQTPPKLRAGPSAPPTPPLPPNGEEVSVNFDQLPLPTFIQVVFGAMLKTNFQVDPQVAQRSDLVSLRTGKPQTRQQLLDLARSVLKSYGVAVIDQGGFFRIVPDSAAIGYSPEIRRGRASPDTPASLRPVFYLVELEVTNANQASAWLRSLFGNRIQVQDDSPRNAVLLSGQGDDVAAAIDAIQLIDQPLMRGRHAARINLAFWSADEMARKLGEVLTAQGYFTGSVANGPQPVILLPVPALNAVLVFANSQEAVSLATRWAQELDTPSAGRGAGYFTYPVRFTDAQDLARTLNELIGGAATPAANSPTGQATARRTRVVVNAATNSLIFQGSADEYTQWIGLVRELDRPARTVLIEATVAEVRLDNSESLGIEWAFTATSPGGTISGGTIGGLGLGSDGMTLGFLRTGASLRVVLNTLATNNKARILSSPRLVARNGEAATIQVGEEVPIITSQQTNATTGNTGVIQTIQYRNTGVILKVRPVIHSGGRVELDVAQEVSAAQRTTTGVNNSPTFLTRKVESKLSLADGATVLLGGLIGQTDGKTESGVPLLKDIPLIGQAFRNNTASVQRTELLVLITPYVIGNDFEARAITDAFRAQLGTWAAPMNQGTSWRGDNPQPLEGPSPSAVPVPVPGPGVEGSATPSAAPAPWPRSEPPAQPVPTPPVPMAAPAPAPVPAPKPAAVAPAAPPAVAPPSAGAPLTDRELIDQLNKATQPPPAKKK